MKHIISLGGCPVVHYSTHAAHGEISPMPDAATLENPALTSIFSALIVESSLPLSAVETRFAVDSSGFFTFRFVRWFDVKCVL